MRAFLLAALVAPALSVAAFSVRVSAPPELRLPERVEASVRRVDGDAAAPRTVLLSTTTSTLLDAGAGTWEIAVNAPDVWAEPVYSSNGQDVTLALWPRGTIRGTVRGEKASAADLIVEFAPASSDVPGPSGKTTCTSEAQRWTCSLPAGTHDLRFRRTGFATEFRWDVKVPAGGAAVVGALQFTPGSSLSGRVTGAKAPQWKDVEISLTPRGNTHAREKTRTYLARPDPRGFFQVRGLPPGDYTLRVNAKDLVADTRNVEIIAFTNAELREPLVLGPPLRVSVRLDPPLDPGQKQWQVQLLTLYEDVSGLVTGSRASPQGEWSATRLPPGDYILQVLQEDGATWATERLTLRAGDPDLPISVSLQPTRVRGRVMLGERPLAATVSFGGEDGLSVIAGDDGRFETLVPPQDENRVALLVTSDVPKVKRNLLVEGQRSSSGELFLDVQLSAGTIVGRTLHEDGSTEPHAMVTITSDDGKVLEQIFVAPDGSFQFEGFEPGSYALLADGPGTSSSVVRVEVPENGVASMDLVLRPEARIRGRVSMGGVPVTGAAIHVFPRNVHMTLPPQATSNGTGHFQFVMPSDVTLMDVIVIPRGFYVTAGRLTPDGKKLLDVQVGQDGGALTVLAPKGDGPKLHFAGAEMWLTWLARYAGGLIEEVDGRQRITIPHLEPGNYSVCQDGKCVSAFIPRLGKASVELP
ncbi:MAG TPA: carboxypeptidase-like regulatory domain-containing protein [Thermoanaerobaculia bacterium]|nr:carboxypeptidase-like regulatory domain-containing protein [Thermoanaerobaculia bacterium]